MVSFGPAKTTEGFARVMLLEPAVVSTTAEADTVTAEFGLPMTSAPVVVDTPLPLNVVRTVLALK
jgi:hypothetical protein